MRLCGCVGTTKAFAESRTIEGVGETKRKREREDESERKRGTEREARTERERWKKGWQVGGTLVHGTVGSPACTVHPVVYLNAYGTVLIVHTRSHGPMN